MEIRCSLASSVSISGLPNHSPTANHSILAGLSPYTISLWAWMHNLRNAGTSGARRPRLRPRCVGLHLRLSRPWGDLILFSGHILQYGDRRRRILHWHAVRRYSEWAKQLRQASRKDRRGPGTPGTDGREEEGLRCHTQAIRALRTAPGARTDSGRVGRGSRR